MMREKIIRCAPLMVACAAMGLGGCAATGPYGYYPPQQTYSPPAYQSPPPETYQQPAYPVQMPAQPQPQPGYGYGTRYGVVSSIAALGPQPGAGVAGAVVGAVAGGLIGNQFGRGHGRDAATVAGALGGALVGNQIEQQYTSQPGGYQVTVQFDDGSSQSFNLPNPGDLRQGDRVRVDGNQISRY